MEARPDEGIGHSPPATVFVADPSSEADRVACALRAAGHLVIDVQPSMLVARAAIQRPHVVLVDADAESALDIVERMRELPGADAIHVLFLARPGGAMAASEDALAREGSGLFLRPIDVSALLQKVQVLTTTVHPEAELARASLPAPALSVSAQPASSSAPSLPPASMRASIPPSTPEVKSAIPTSPRPSRVPSDPPGPVGGSLLPRRTMGLAPPVSPELQQLLAEAEQRVIAQGGQESIVVSPEDEIEAVLPADLLAALDEPLDEDDDDDEGVAAPGSTASPPAVRERKSTRGTRPNYTSTRAGPNATSQAPRTGPGVREETAGPYTHAGATGDGVSTTGGADAQNSSDAPAPSEHGSLPPPVSSTLGEGDAMRIVARAIASRTTGSLCLMSTEDASPSVSPARQYSRERRIVLREGDVVITCSNAQEESLLAFLGVRGDLPRETVRRLATKFPAYGRHAGAALVARGYLRQDQMWPTLRAHAEWLFSRALQTDSGRLVLEPQNVGRLGAEPSVFGGSTGAAVFVEAVRRIVSPAEAVEHLGGLGAQVRDGPETALLEECALDAAEVEQVRAARGHSLRSVLGAMPESDLAAVLLALSLLGVVAVERIAGEKGIGDEDSEVLDVSALDTEAVRERVRARLQLVDDGDYFAVLGVSRDATAYEVRRAYLELRRTFEPSRLLTPEIPDLADDVRKITVVLDEAYDILKDAARRERYRRAIEAVPDR